MSQDEEPIDEILEEFLLESKSLVDDMAKILDEIEDDVSQAERITDVSLYVDRIMGGVKIIAMGYDEDHMIHNISNYTELCKLIGYKAAEHKENEHLYNICVAFLIDATETIDKMLQSLKGVGTSEVKDHLSETFLNRLKWIKAQFEALEASGPSLEQNQIDDLLSKLGIG